VSGGWLGKGHGGAAAYPGSGVGDGGIAHSYKRGRQWSGGFGHGLSGQRYREWHGLLGRGGSGWKWTRHVAATRRRCADDWARRGKRRLTGGFLMSAISELKFTPG
jgi:hypothetical protein